MKKFENIKELANEFKKLIESIGEGDDDWSMSEFFTEEYDDFYDTPSNSEITKPIRDIIGRFKLVDSSEWHHREEVEYVYHLIDHNVYFEVSGYYDSYNGLDMNDMYFTQVEPIEVTRIEYKPVN